MRRQTQFGAISSEFAFSIHRFRVSRRLYRATQRIGARLLDFHVLDVLPPIRTYSKMGLCPDCSQSTCDCFLHPTDERRVMDGHPAAALTKQRQSGDITRRLVGLRLTSGEFHPEGMNALRPRRLKMIRIDHMLARILKLTMLAALMAAAAT